MSAISFKSSGSCFSKEFDNIKNNTVRKVDLTDNRFTILKAFEDKKIKELKITVVCKEEPLAYFDRIVKDVTFYEDLCVITWYI